MADIKYDIIEEIGTLSENVKGWWKGLNLISWNGGAAKYDIRDWAPDHEKVGKGTTLTEEEMENLKEILGLIKTVTEALVWQESVRRKAMLERWKKQLSSEDGMKIVNVLSILLYLVRNPLSTICAYAIWFVYLAYSVRHTKSKGTKIFYSVLSMLVMATVLLNAYFTILQPGTMRKEIRELVKKTNA